MNMQKYVLELDSVIISAKINSVYHLFSKLI